MNTSNAVGCNAALTCAPQADRRTAARPHKEHKAPRPSCIAVRAQQQVRWRSLLWKLDDHRPRHRHTHVTWTHVCACACTRVRCCCWYDVCVCGGEAAAREFGGVARRGDRARGVMRRLAFYPQRSAPCLAPNWRSRLSTPMYAFWPQQCGCACWRGTVLALYIELCRREVCSHNTL